MSSLSINSGQRQELSLPKAHLVFKTHRFRARVRDHLAVRVAVNTGGLPITWGKRVGFQVER